MLLIVLGRQPGLARAELEALLGQDKLTLIGDGGIVAVDAPVIQTELGGAIKVARQLDSVASTKFETVVRHISKKIPDYLGSLPAEGKVKFGLSVYGLDTNPSAINRSGLFLKKSLRQLGRSVRAVPNSEEALNSAQVLHNGLTSPLGLELLLIRDGDHTLIARNIREQDIEAYTLRDRGRPKRDAFVGMLPPKLAQIMIHLAAGRNLQSIEDSDKKGRLLDPFCGTGVVLQEAALEGHAVYGTDLSQRMVDYTSTNLKWLGETHHIDVDSTLEAGDATSHQWQPPIDAVVCEGYLGRPLGGQNPNREQLAEIIHDCNATMRGFLKNLAPQLASGTPLCVAAPAWFIGDEIRHLPVLDDLEDMGYNRIDFVHADNTELIYHREGQVVGRELVILRKV